MRKTIGTILRRTAGGLLFLSAWASDAGAISNRGLACGLAAAALLLLAGYALCVIRPRSRHPDRVSPPPACASTAAR